MWSVHTKTSQQIPLRLFASLERMARLVDISYCVGTTGINKPFICANRCRDFPTLELVKTWNTGMLMSDSCGYIAVDHGPNKAIIVAFRGTYSITNTVVDLATVPQDYTPYPVPDNGDDGQARKYQCQNCVVHSGFFSSWKNARRFVVPHLKHLREKYPSHKIHLVGHSLGGAVAALAAVELKVGLDWDNILVTTFGEPRVGNQGVADFFNQVFGLNDTAADASGPEDWIFRRVTHTNDPVPLLPPSQWGYRAHSGEIYISKLELYPDLSDVRACLGANDPTCIAGDEESEIKKNVLAKLVQQAKNGDDEDKNHNYDTYAPNSAEIWVLRNSHKLRAISLGVPTLWELFFAHRDYFWRLGLCVPGGNFGDWDKHHYYLEDRSDEL
ncbi:hypothetical protein Cpir12675_000214 [Ceratocystis pirilliformis]|uniref:Fungal lipase-type domain-containing protein n=1 Tax=Ceratocystis pirilliformis TaxID=259994 RepID=A0ABR3ZNE2_9PEZI